MIFVLDTNVLWKITKLIQLASAARRHGHRVEIPVLVHAERAAQLRREKGAAFDPAVIEAFIKTHGLTVAPFDKEVAERCAESLAERYSSKEGWHDARRRRCEARFQMAQAAAGRPCPATIDWYLAASYTSPPFTFVTLDGNSEFEGTPAISLDSAIHLAETT
jgi:predicted nucleic acid-binding protein